MSEDDEARTSSRSAEHSVSAGASTSSPPATPAHRSPAAGSSWLQAGSHLQQRDQVLLRLLHAHITLTGPQIQALLFATPDSAQTRLARLRRQGWITNFRTQRRGHRLPLHWVLAEWGSRWAAFNAGEPEPTPRSVRARTESVAASSQLEHTDGVHDFFVALVVAARAINQNHDVAAAANLTNPAHPEDQHHGASLTGSSANVTQDRRLAPGSSRPARSAGSAESAGPAPSPAGYHLPQAPRGRARLARWWSGADTARALDGNLRPDGHGVWEYVPPRTQPPQSAPTDVADVPDMDYTADPADLSDVAELADEVSGADAHHQGSGGEEDELLQVSFYLEYDRGTEPLARVADKLGPYQRVLEEGLGPDWFLLIVVPTARRERHLHEHVRRRHSTASGEPVRHSAQTPAHPYQAYQQPFQSHQPYRDHGGAVGGTGLRVLTTSLQHIADDRFGPAGHVWARLPWAAPPLPAQNTRADDERASGQEQRIALWELAMPVAASRAPRAVYDPGPAAAQDDPLPDLPPL